MPAIFSITNCTVTQNQHVGIIIHPSGALTAEVLQSNISNNFKRLESDYCDGYEAVCAAAIAVNCRNGSNLTIADSVFKGNSDLALDSKIVYAFNCSKTSIMGINKFEDNIGTPLKMYGGQLSVSGTTVFSRNHAFRGGGISMIYSRLYLEKNTAITFERNVATDLGGALYYPTIRENKDALCFYQLGINSSNETKDLNITVYFTANTATNGGETLFGAVLDDICSVTPSHFIRSAAVFQNIFVFTTNSSELSTFSSEPTRVCLCNSSKTPQCAEKEYILHHLNHTIYPGETFGLSAVIVGRGLGTASGSVYATTTGYTELNSADFESSQRSQAVEFSQCNSIQYTVHAFPQNNLTLVLTTSVASTRTVLSDFYVTNLIEQYNDRNSDELLTIPVYVMVFVEDCPLGFSILSKTLPICECARVLTSNGIDNCPIQNHTGLVHRAGNIWIGSIDGEIFIDQGCPYGYCQNEDILVELNNSDSEDHQCTSNRTGILCGRCKPGFSLALGSHLQCIKCPNNWYIALIIPILLSTLILIALLKFLDLTVANGGINGLIFYVNVVWANRGVLLTSSYVGWPDYVVRLILAWLNLDFGFETCFVDGMDALGKTWFHFGQDFLYIIVITSVIIVSSRYSVLATRLAGNNSVPLLATIVFLSYTKLLQTIIDSLSFNVLKGENSTKIVWSLDGNVSYFSNYQHAILFAIATLSFVLLELPYTIFLLFGQCLRRCTHIRVLKWMDKQKPYFDAYYGPFKDEYHYWFGMLLLARVVLLVLHALISTTYPEANLLAVIIVGSCILMHPFQYKNWVNSLLDKVFTMNLVLVAAGTLYCELKQIDPTPVAVASVLFSVFIFIMIVGHRTCIVIWNCVKKSRMNSRYVRLEQEGYDVIDRIPPENSKQYEYGDDDSKYREPLLESSYERNS